MKREEINQTTDQETLLKKIGIDKGCTILAETTIPKDWENSIESIKMLSDSMFFVFVIDRMIESGEDTSKVKAEFLREINEGFSDSDIESIKKNVDDIISNMQKEKELTRDTSTEEYLRIKGSTIGFDLIDAVLSGLFKKNDKDFIGLQDETKKTISNSMRKINDSYANKETVNYFSLTGEDVQNPSYSEEEVGGIMNSIQNDKASDSYKASVMKLIYGIIKGYEKRELGAT